MNNSNSCDSENFSTSTMNEKFDEIEIVEVSKCPFREDSFASGSFLNYPVLWKWKLSTMVSSSTVAAFLISSASKKAMEKEVEQVTSAGVSLINSTLSSGPTPSINSFLLSSSIAGALFVGTFLQAASANSMNQVFERDLDAKMSRTKSRPLVQNYMSKKQAVIQSIILSGVGTMILYKYTNLTTTLLGVANIVLYTCVYTPLKTRHWINTWVGTLNGTLPILMGAATVEPLNSLSPITILSCLTLYCWQIPHFMAISFKCKNDYERAGFQMLPLISPTAAAVQSVLHSFLLFPACIWAYRSNAIPFSVLSISLPLNFFLLFKPSLSFYENPSAESAHTLFVDSLYHLPSFFALLACSPFLNSENLSSFSDSVVSLFSSLFSFDSFSSTKSPSFHLPESKSSSSVNTILDKRV